MPNTPSPGMDAQKVYLAQSDEEQKRAMAKHKSLYQGKSGEALASLSLEEEKEIERTINVEIKDEEKEAQKLKERQAEQRRCKRNTDGSPEGRPTARVDAKSTPEKPLPNARG